MVKQRVDDEARRRNTNFSAGPTTVPLLKALAEFQATIEPDARWSIGRTLDFAVERAFFDTISEKLRERFPNIGFSIHDPTEWQLGERAARVVRIDIADIEVEFNDPPGRSVTMRVPLKVPHVIERLAHFFTHGVPSVTVFFPSHGNLADGLPVVVTLFDFATGASHVFQSLAAPDAELPPLGALAVIREMHNEYRGTIDQAEYLDLAGDGSGRCLNVFVTQNRPRK
jgi:hypothetical protein